MIRTILAHTQNRNAIAGAAKSLAMHCALRVFSPADLMELKAPVLLVFDSWGHSKLTPDFLQYLRRTHPGGVRYSPAVVFCKSKEEMQEWRAAGAIAVSAKADQLELQAAITAALSGERKWVTSAVYVGPDRRDHKAFFRVHRRRREDGAAAAAKAAKLQAPEPTQVASLDRLHRRVLLSAQLLRGSPIEDRRAFRALIGELEASVSAHRRSDLAGVAQTLRTEADRLLRDQNADTRVLEEAVAKLGAGVHR